MLEFNSGRMEDGSVPTIRNESGNIHIAKIARPGPLYKYISGVPVVYPFPLQERYSTPLLLRPVDA